MVDDAETPPQPTSASTLPAESSSTSTTVVSLAEARVAKAALPPTAGASAPDAGTGESAPPSAAKQPKKEKEIDWGKFNHLVENFTLIYPTDTVWDGDKRKIVKIGNLAHAFSSDYVRMWKASASRKQVDDHEVVFDPTETCPEHFVNLFDGIGMEPEEG